MESMFIVSDVHRFITPLEESIGDDVDVIERICVSSSGSVLACAHADGVIRVSTGLSSEVD